MHISGFSIANNAVRLGYPIEASLRSLLPLVDEVILNIGEGDQETWDLVEAMREPKIKPFRSWWDPNLRHGGHLLAQQTNLALERCRGDWGMYLQADEVLHEQDYDRIRKAMRDELERSSEVLCFRYRHFYGSFQTVQDHPRRWYWRAARAVKLGIGVASWGDAMDFCVRCHGREWLPRQANVRAYIYHYGWARPPEVMRAKQEAWQRLYHNDAVIEQLQERQSRQQIYSDLGNLRFFRGTHPSVMREIVARQNWTFDHGIGRQPPEWIRRPRVWADLYWHHLLPAAAHMRERWRRVRLERKTRNHPAG